VIQPFERAIGRKVLGTSRRRGPRIIKELGEEHVRTGRPIVYTSADSVFQIAAHEEVVPLEQLYEWCRIAREQLTGRDEVGRVIARPFHRQTRQLSPHRSSAGLRDRSARGHLARPSEVGGVGRGGGGKIGSISAIAALLKS